MKQKKMWRGEVEEKILLWLRHQEVNTLKLKIRIFDYTRALRSKIFPRKKNMPRFILIYFLEFISLDAEVFVNDEMKLWRGKRVLLMINYFFPLLPFAWLIIQTFYTSKWIRLLTRAKRIPCQAQKRRFLLLQI